MVDVSSQNNSVSINVSSGGNSATIKATPDMAQYYSEKSREWAISNRIVDNTDYSSKYYANKADQSALSAKNYAQLAENSYGQIQGSVDDVLDNINSSAQTAINAIDLKGEEEKEAISTVAQGAVAGVKQESQIQMSTIQQVSQLEQEEIQEIINRIEDGKAVYVGENEPTDPIYTVWVDPDERDLTLDIEEVKNDIIQIQNDIDGEWVGKFLSLAENVALSTTVTWYSLTSYLPNDTNKYEVIMQAYVSANTGYGNLYCGSSVISEAPEVATAKQGQVASSPFNMIVGADHKVKVYCGSSANGKGVYYLKAAGYRKVR
jgi:hypothetical protein